MERVNQYFKDRIESFDDYYPCVKNECNLFHVYNWIQFFVFMYNDTTFENDFINELNGRGEYYIKLTEPIFSVEIFTFFYRIIICIPHI
jgi:hypothetical protein